MKRTTQIKGVEIYDGTGNASYVGDVNIEDGKFVETLCRAPDEIVDGTGLCAAPGFIDVHTHSDYCLGMAYNSLSRVSQGITTQIAGQCGKSAAIRNAEMFDELIQDFPLIPCPGYDQAEQFQTFAGYMDYVDHLPMVENTAFFVGHGNLRKWVMGYSDRYPSHTELAQMKELLTEAMEHGSPGLSSGLIYAPGVYAGIDELTELCKVVRQYDGIYTTHIRSEGDRVLEAMAEAIEVARRSGCRLNISHLKVCGKCNEGLSEKMLDLIRRGQEEGISITADQYPYAAGATGMSTCIHPRHFTEGPEAFLEKLSDPYFRQVLKDEMLYPPQDFESSWISCGGPEGIGIGDCKITLDARGKSIAQYAKETGKDPFDTLFDLLLDNRLEVLGIYHEMNESDVRRIIKMPYVLFGCDSAAPEPGTAGHPRTFGTFTRVLGRYVREEGLLTMPEAIRRMTGLAAEVYGLKGKGYIRPGMDADLVLFSSKTVMDTATYEQPEGLSRGIERVWISGETVYENGQLNQARPGKGLRYGR